MDENDAHHIKDLLESSDLNNRRLGVIMMSEMIDFDPIVEAFWTEDKILLIQTPADLKKYIESEEFKEDENWAVWEDVYHYTFKKELPYFIIHKTQGRLKIEDVGKWEGKWKKLTDMVSLTLKNNQFEKFPSAVNYFRKLESLELEGNQLPVFPHEILALPRLLVIKYRSNQTTLLPARLVHGECMRLDLGENKLEAFPGRTKVKLLRLTDLILQGNNINKLGEVIEDFDCLRNLNLLGNPLEHLPKELYRLYTLGSLNLAETNIEKLSPEISQLEKLYSLNIRSTAIKKLPEEVLKLRLKRLDISFTSMAEDRDYVQYLKKRLPKTTIKDKI
ncbi:MAG: leucine-rich repeat domain-containing protein [Aureispira sp.]|nr:leucine-rich repeat domain-containing protein [Aureispira sp.]